MAPRQPRSLKHEYELYVEREIENYKDSVPRSTLLKIGDEAVAALGAESQLTLTEMLLCEEVDRIIRRRLRLPSYQTWRRRRIRELEELRRPEYWGLAANDPLVRAIHPGSADSHVLLAGKTGSAPALYLAANGCEVMAIDHEEDGLRDVLDAAEAAGLADRVHPFVGALETLEGWTPDSPLAAVVCASSAFEGLTSKERAKVFAALQGVTAAGGVHLVGSLPGDAPASAGRTRSQLTVEELRRRYKGWQVSVEALAGAGHAFLARKAVA